MGFFFNKFCCLYMVALYFYVDKGLSFPFCPYSEIDSLWVFNLVSEKGRFNIGSIFF